jgi:phytoene desaturase
MQNPDVIVIGAGVGGLSAAIRLAVASRRVLVLERGAVVGGKMFEVREAGFRWDTGPSVITMRPVIADLFNAAGRRLEDYLRLEPIDPLTRYFFPGGGRIDLRRDLPLTLDQIPSPDVSGYLSYLAEAAYLDRVTSPVFTYGPPPSPASLLRIPPLDALRVGWLALQTMDRRIRRHVRSRELRQIFGRYATYVGSSPFQAPSVLSVIANVELAQGVYYPRGGVYAIARALERLANELGVEIRCGAEATKISCGQTGNGRTTVTGVELANGESITARAIIANLDVSTVYDTLLAPSQSAPNRLPASLKASAADSCSAFVLLLGVEGQHPDLIHHNILFSSDYRREFEQIFRDGQPPDDPTIYIAITSRTDPEHAPAGCENWFVQVNVSAADGRYDWRANETAYRERVLACLRDRGFDIGGRLRVVQSVTPIEIEAMNGARRGALYGASMNGILSPFLRPANRARGVDGLYFAGGTTHPGGGVPMVMLSGKLAAGMLMEDFG